MQAIKETVQSLAGLGKTANTPDGFAKPKDYPSQTQHGAVVGIEAKMSPLPEFLHQEGGYDTYKAANKLNGKKALVTGGDSGIGRAVAVIFAMEGADVAIGYLPEEQEDAEVTKQHIEKYGRRCLLLPYDIQIELRRDENRTARVLPHPTRNYHALPYPTLCPVPMSTKVWLKC